MTKALRFRVIYERKHREMRLPAPMKVKLPALPHGASWRRGVKVRKSYQNISEGSWIEDRRYLQPGTSADLSDISKVLEPEDILRVRIDISEVIRVKTPFASQLSSFSLLLAFLLSVSPLHRFPVSPYSFFLPHALCLSQSALCHEPCALRPLELPISLPYLSTTIQVAFSYLF